MAPFHVRWHRPLALALLLVLAAAASVESAPAAERVCFPAAFETKAFLVDPVNNYYDNTTIWFDATTNRQRIDIQIFQPNAQDTTVLLRGDLGAGYQFDDNGANCFSFLFATTLTQFCLSDQATMTGTITLAGRKLQQWVDVTADGKTVKYTVLPYQRKAGGDDIVIPVNAALFDRITTFPPTPDASLVNFTEWFDFVPRPAGRGLANQAIFDVPAGCPPPGP